jgi:hypothetical protein
MLAAGAGHPAVAGVLGLGAAAGHPAVAGLLGLGAAGLAGGVVVMAWSLHARQIRLAEQLARRQFLVTADAPSTNGHGPERAAANGDRADRVAHAGPVPVVIDGPDTVVTGEQARYRVPLNGTRKVVSWAAGGGSLAQAPDPAHPDELLLVADEPGNLSITVWVREGMTERRATKPVTAVPDVTPPGPPVTVRLFLQAWGLVVVAVLIVGFAAALEALGSFASSDFIALAALLAALLGVIAVARGSGDAPGPAGPGGLSRREGAARAGRDPG